MIKRKSSNKTVSGQAILEFVFAMIVALIMLFGTVMIFQWAGVDLASRQRAHEQTLNTPLDVFQEASNGSLLQLDGFFFDTVKINATFNAN